MSTTTDLTELVINYLTEAQYEAAVSGGTIDPDQLYLTPETNVPVTDVEVDGVSVVTGNVAEIDLTGKADASHTHTVSDVTDFPSLATVATSGAYSDLSGKPSIPTITDTYSGTSSNGMSGKAVKSAIDALDGTVSGTAGSGKTLTAFSQTDGKVSATFGNISITKSQVSDFPSIPSTAADVGAVPTSRTVNGKVLSSDITLTASDVGAVASETDPVFTASDAYGISSTDISEWDNAYNGNISLDTTAASGDDYNLKTILTTLGWLTDVIV